MPIKINGTKGIGTPTFAFFINNAPILTVPPINIAKKAIAKQALLQAQYQSKHTI